MCCTPRSDGVRHSMAPLQRLLIEDALRSYLGIGASLDRIHQRNRDISDEDVSTSHTGNSTRNAPTTDAR